MSELANSLIAPHFCTLQTSSMHRPPDLLRDENCIHPRALAPGRGAPGRRPRHTVPETPPGKEKSAIAPTLVDERGVTCDVANAFYRAHSILSRDLAVLAARQISQLGTCDVVDVLTGAGIRAARYLAHAKARRVLANDISTKTRVAENLASVAQRHGVSGTYETTHEDGCRLLSRLALEGQTFDVVDIDGFGSDGVPVSLALGCVTFGGVLILNSTDWAGFAGREHSSTIAAYGAVAHECPSSAENALRVLLGSAARDAAQRGMHVQPLVAYAAPGPAYRLILRVTRGRSAAMTQSLGFNFYCPRCCAMWATPWTAVSSVCAHCGADATEASGPLWHGPLHCGDMLRNMQIDAHRLGWLVHPNLNGLLAVLREEADAFGRAPDMPPYYVRLDQIASAAKVKHRMPSRDALIRELEARGFTATRTHCDQAALKTNAPWGTLLDAAHATS